MWQAKVLVKHASSKKTVGKEQSFRFEKAMVVQGVAKKGKGRCRQVRRKSGMFHMAHVGSRADMRGLTAKFAILRSFRRLRTAFALYSEAWELKACERRPRPALLESKRREIGDESRQASFDQTWEHSGRLGTSSCWVVHAWTAIVPCGQRLVAAWPWISYIGVPATPHIL